VEQTRQTLDNRRRRLIGYFRITSSTVFVTLVVTLGLYLMRLFRWETAISNWLSSVKTMLLP